jgi:hypothetical protein
VTAPAAGHDVGVTDARPEPEPARARVVASVGLTINEGTARMWHGSRRGGPTGTASGLSHGEGEVDFIGRRARYVVVGLREGQEEGESWGEALWDGPRHYFRAAPDQPWGDPVPLIAIVKRPGAIAYSSPWWLLDALCGARDDAHVIGRELVRGTSTEHIRVSVDVAAAVNCSSQSLALPRTPADAFPAEVWLDELGRLRRMSCTWPQKRRPWWWKRFGPPSWMTTEFWDFGAAVRIAPASHGSP